MTISVAALKAKADVTRAMRSSIVCKRLRRTNTGNIGLARH